MQPSSSIAETIPSDTPASARQDFGALTPLLAPASVAVVGASDREGNAGGTAVGFLKKFGFAGDIWPVNPGRSEVGGLKCYPSLADLPGVPDLAIIATPAKAVAGVVDECVAAGVPAALAWAGGFAEGGEEGRALQVELQKAAARGGVKFCGPNCLGVINTSIGLTASFGSMLAEYDALLPGAISIVSQSGGIATMAHARAQQAGFGFRVTVSCGNEAVLTAADFIKALAQDAGTKVIAVYIEGVQSPGDFVEALAEARRRNKPVVIMKGGASAASERAALAHTGRLAGVDRTFDAIFREFAAIRVYSLEEMLDVSLQLATLPHGRLPAGNRVVMSTFGGGSGVLATDQCASEGLEVPVLSPATVERARSLLTPLAAVGNPVDLTPQSVNDPHWLGQLPQALGTVADDPNVDTYLFLVGGLGHRSRELADLVQGLRETASKPVVMSWLFSPQRALDDMAARGIFVFPEHARAARTIGRLARHTAEKQLRLGRKGTATAFDWRRLVPETEGQVVVSENTVAAILHEAGLAVARGELATSPAHAAEIAERVGFPVVAKGISPAITHRAAAGFVELNLWTADAVQRTDADYRRRAKERGAPYEGTWVQRMITGNRELLVTAFRDSDFGTMVGVGIGGNMTEIVDDVTFTRAPIDADGAYDLVGQLRSVRKHPDFLTETQRRAAADFIGRFSALVASAPWRRFTLEVNPLKLDTDAAAAVDGLLIVEDARPIG